MGVVYDSIYPCFVEDGGNGLWMEVLCNDCICSLKSCWVSFPYSSCDDILFDNGVVVFEKKLLSPVFGS